MGECEVSCQQRLTGASVSLKVFICLYPSAELMPTADLAVKRLLQPYFSLFKTLWDCLITAWLILFRRTVSHCTLSAPNGLNKPCSWYVHIKDTGTVS